ncbi:branched-chain amino acid ABC transporter permease [Paraburkholderia dipogonis]|uniref:Branched-chain amino acid ABC transporter permease n=1 Tax=Paraburkholderia dipogonis TaxID=1211383 RepID=A0A4Y8MYD9_9BURK|nr:AzlC family ABC transporter permease [Paraburkholderia dipogonis]TFE42385.1 branched-chain amino acid ABC transporter permease [Paraburkholderia dipogonis]
MSQACAVQGSPGQGFNEFRRGLIRSLPMAAAMVPFALVLGAQAIQKGLSVFEVPLMTGLNFAGGSEFAAVGLWTSPPHVLLITAITLLLNCRHILMGATLTPYLARLSKRRAMTALFLMCDESWAMGLADAEASSSNVKRRVFSVLYYVGCSASLYVTWVAFTTVGAVIGPTLGDVDRYGFDMAFPAVFLVILRGMWKGYRAARPWLVSLLAAVATYLLIPGAWYVAAGASAGVVSAYVLGVEK